MQKKHSLQILLSILLIASCSSNNVEYKYPKSKEERERQELGSIIAGEDEIAIKNGKIQTAKKQETNEYLWQAALQVISDFPISSADKASGTIITEWYVSQAAPNEKFKFVIIISNSALDANTLSIKGHKQIRNSRGEFVNAKMSDSVIKDLESKILTTAKKIRISKY